jgi:hypothetical protein
LVWRWTIMEESGVALMTAIIMGRSISIGVRAQLTEAWCNATDAWRQVFGLPLDEPS